MLRPMDLGRRYRCRTRAELQRGAGCVGYVRENAVILSSFKTGLLLVQNGTFEYFYGFGLR